jgi:hypothetical protein
MMKPFIELIRDGEHKALLEWHRPDGNGGHIPIAFDFADSLDEESRQRIMAVCARPLTVREAGVAGLVQPGSSKHFLALPKVLERQQYRVRSFAP